MLIAIGQNVSKSKELCDLVLEPDALKKFGGFELGRTKEIFDIGYQEAMKVVDSLPILQP